MQKKKKKHTAWWLTTKWLLVIPPPTSRYRALPAPQEHSPLPETSPPSKVTTDPNSNTLPVFKFYINEIMENDLFVSDLFSSNLHHFYCCEQQQFVHFHCWIFHIACISHSMCIHFMADRYLDCFQFSGCWKQYFSNHACKFHVAHGLHSVGWILWSDSLHLLITVFRYIIIILIASYLVFLPFSNAFPVLYSF